MKIFIDSAKIEEITFLSKIGILDGVTTNPSLIKSAVEEQMFNGNKIDMFYYIVKILETVGKGKSVSLEVASTNYEQMVKEGLVLYKKFNKFAKNVFIKIPINTATSKGDNDFEGLKAINYFSREGIPVNCTLIFTPEQALMAAKAGAAIVSPFAGRIDDMLREKARMKFQKSDYFSGFEPTKVKGKSLEDNGIISGVNLVSKIVQIFKKYEIKTQVLAASIRNARQFRECALVGVDIVTAPLTVILDSLKHEKTVEGVNKFSFDVVQEYREILR